MTTRREPTSQRDDAPLHVVGHRLQKIEADARGSEAANGDVHRAPASASPMAGRPPAGLRSARGRSTVLRQVVLVDREIDALRDVAIALRDEYDFHITISGTEALNLLRNGGIDTIVVGQTLYSSTGLTVLAEARRHAPTTHRVLLANAVEAGSVERGAAAVAPFRVLHRPCTPEKLRDLLDANAAPAPLEGSNVPPDQMRIQPTESLSHSDTHDPAEFEHVVLETEPEQPRRRNKATRKEISGEAGASLPVIVYTDNAEFYHAITQALQDRHELRLCTQLERAAEFAEMGQCPLLITDRAATQVELQRISIALRALDANNLTIAAGTPETGAALRKLLGTGALHSFLPTPINAPLVRLAVESAKRQYLETKALRDSQPELKTTPTTSPFTTRPAANAYFVPNYRADYSVDDYDQTAWRRAAPKVALGIAALALLLAGGWFGWQRFNAPADPELERELTLARQAYSAGRYATTDNGALYHYNRALQRAPGNEAAANGMEQTLERVIEQAEQALLAEQLDVAANSIEAVRELQPRNKRLPFLESQLDKERAKQTAERRVREAANPIAPAALQTPGTKSTEQLIAEARAATPINNETQRMQAVTRWLTLARQRIAQDRLIAPENDSAEFYLRQAERADPDNASVRQGLRDVGIRLLAGARDALSKQQLDLARRRVADAGRFGAETSALQKLSDEIEAAASVIARGNFLRLSLQRTRDNRLFEPERDSAKYYLGQLERLDPYAAETQQAAQALALRLIENANQAIQQQQLNAAMQLLNETRRLGFAGPELSAAETRLRTARNPVAPAGAARPPAAPPKPIRTVAPKFPEDAMRAGIQGWVDVGFRITPGGDVIDVVALASSPPGRYAAQFERAAVAALSQYKYQARPGETAPQSMVQKVQFRLGN